MQKKQKLEGGGDNDIALGHKCEYFASLIVVQKIVAQKYLVGARKNSGDEVAINSLSQVMQQRSGMCTENDDFCDLVNWYNIGSRKNPATW